jgi:hypothetical protein
MVDNAITDITIYHEDWPCSAPSATRILELFKGVTRHLLNDGEGHLVKTFPPTLSAKQLQLLDLLGISADRCLCVGDVCGT